MRSVWAYEIFNKFHKSINISSDLDIKSKGEVDVTDNSLDFGFHNMMAYTAICEENSGKGLSVWIKIICLVFVFIVYKGLCDIQELSSIT